MSASNLKRRDPAVDPKAGIKDFVYRLRRMGYPGNVRVEFPVYLPLDVRWVATLMDTAARALVEVVREMGPGDSAKPLAAVLEARAVLVRLDRELQRHTSAAEVKALGRQAAHE